MIFQRQQRAQTGEVFTFSILGRERELERATIPTYLRYSTEQSTILPDTEKEERQASLEAALF